MTSITCPNCGYEYIYGFAEKHKTEACPACGSQVKQVCTLYVGKHKITLDVGNNIYLTHIDKYASEYNKVIGTVVANKNNPSIWGIKLSLDQPVEVKDGKGNEKSIDGSGVIPIIQNLKIKFNENCIGEIG